MARAMADLFRCSVNSFLGLRELHGELAHDFKEFLVLALQARELRPRRSARCSLPQPIIDRGIRDARVFCRLRDCYSFLLNAPQDVRFHILRYAVIFFTHYKKDGSDRPLCLK